LPSGNILELFLTTMLAAITAITNVGLCDDDQIFEKVQKNLRRRMCDFPLLPLSFPSSFPSLSLEVGPLNPARGTAGVL